MGPILMLRKYHTNCLKRVLKDLSTIAFFRSHNAWFIWVLNVATSFTYGACLMVRYPKIREAVRRKK